MGLALLALLAGTGACSAIIASELGDKPGSGGSTSHTGTGGAHVDGGTGGATHGCTGDGDCANAAHPVCDVDAGVCVPCTPSDDPCPAGQHCTPANHCAPGCSTAADCPSLANAMPACSGGVCILGSCLPGFGDCDGLSADGCEVDLSKSPLDCGTCGNACSLLHASATCTAGKCAVVSCAAGYADCDGITENGCEVDTQGDVDNCGACGHLCMLANATTTCMAGACAISACAPGFLDCDELPADGCEVASNTDMQNCGGCGAVCSLPNASAKCAMGKCAIDSCATGFADCDGEAKTGCEADLQTTVASCGSCGNGCSTNHASPSCAGGACSLSCAPGYGDCNGNVADGCETATTSDATNCGSCGHVCPSTGGTPYCANGTCGVVSCPAGFGACSGGSCTTNLTNDPQNCGSCGHACVVANGTAACSNGTCAVASCNPGFADCDGSYADGCEASLTTTASCGACGAACALPNATSSCSTGTCAIVSCTGTFADCDGVAANGCEVDTSSSVAACGACGAACSAVNGTPSCTMGKCAIACNPGFGDCDGNPADGCETNLATSPSHCGACSTVCSLPNAVAACSNGTCAVGSCVPPYADCDGVAANGCEVNTSTSPAHCGSCADACAVENGTPTCAASTCGITCNPGYGNCDGMASNGCEASLQTDVNNCGSCGHVCPTNGGTPNCIGGVCGIATCSPGVGNCSGGGCTDNLLSDPQNCGSCGNVCSVANGTAVCANGACKVGSCNPGWADCDGTYADGCEANLKTNANCGACGTTCALANATSSCATGSCAIVACNGSYADCDGLAADGCEVNLATSPSHCGACNNACSTANATPSCVSGACVLACSPGFGDCDMNAANGCETNTNESVLNCGACGRACASTNVASLDCSGGICDAACALGYGNCSEPAAPAADDGCETNVAADASACGSCANACTLQGAPGHPFVCEPKPAAADQCGCTSNAACNVGSANGTCKGNGLCSCNMTVCAYGEVCVHQATDVCSCNGGAACGAGQTCCQTPAGCVDLTSDAGSCGACGHACPAGFSCQSSQCKCTASSQCDAGSPGVCVASGLCQCGGTICAQGQRCLPNGVCG